MFKKISITCLLSIALCSLSSCTTNESPAKPLSIAPNESDVTKGSLTKEEIETVIRGNLNNIRMCYEKNLQLNKNLQGRVTVQFIIGKDGKVSKSSIKETLLKDNNTQDCVTAEILTWQFPIPGGSGNVNVTYPFVFAPKG